MPNSSLPFNPTVPTPLHPGFASAAPPANLQMPWAYSPYGIHPVPQFYPSSQPETPNLNSTVSLPPTRHPNALNFDEDEDEDEYSEFERIKDAIDPVLRARPNATRANSTG
ncbi:1731_t:CDS:1, partial [Acaulospora colombiana]